MNDCGCSCCSIVVDKDNNSVKSIQKQIAAAAAADVVDVVLLFAVEIAAGAALVVVFHCPLPEHSSLVDHFFHHH